MGVGDDIMASGQARNEFRRTGKRVKICDSNGRPRWSDVWQGLDWIAEPWARGDFSSVTSAAGCRPYVKYPWNGTRQEFTAWRARDNIGGLLFTESEVAFAQHVALRHPGFVLIEPNVKPRANPNKSWGFHRWQRLADSMPQIRWVQIGAKGSRVLRGVSFIETGTFRLAAAVLSNAALSILPEGGLHHAAAHTGKRAVVVWGGVVPVETLGYPWHENIADESVGSPCGNWKRCEHCARVWARITPDLVKSRIERAVATQAAA